MSAKREASFLEFRCNNLFTFLVGFGSSSVPIASFIESAIRPLSAFLDVLVFSIKIMIVRANVLNVPVD
jgi:hypothetical protein